MAMFVITFALPLGIVSCSDDDDDSDDVIEINRVNKEKGEKFLAENRENDSVKVTYTGLQYKVKKAGNGVKPILSDSVTLSMVNTLVDGTVFFEKTETSVLASNLEGIKEGLLHMSEGSEFVLYIPYYLAYGTSSRTFSYKGYDVTAGAYSALILDCKLERVVKN